jgi:hypothetical protein
MISIKTHSVLDYAMAFALAVFPHTLGANIQEANAPFFVMGALMLLVSFFTNSRFSPVKVVPVGIHMKLDIAAGVLAILAPFIFKYRDRLSDGAFGLHLVAGMILILFVGLTHYRRDESIAGSKVTIDGGFHWGHT